MVGGSIAVGVSKRKSAIQERARAAEDRLGALDVLRGITILGMMLSDCEPWTELPGWMYHGQEPPPAHKLLVGHPGITWVDLVFPFFLFSLGVAIPLAGARRLDRGESPAKIILGGLWRSLALVAFAFFVQHLAPYSMSANPTDLMFWLGMVGFALAVPIFARLPEAWPASVRFTFRASGAVLALALIQNIRYPDGQGFSWNRSDDILLILATVIALANAIWVATRKYPAVRWCIVAGVLGASLGASVPGSPLGAVWGWQGAHWVFQPAFAFYLAVSLPGTIVGEDLSRFPFPEIRCRQSALTLAACCLLLSPGMVVAYYTRTSPWLTELGFAAAIALLCLRFRDPLITKLMTMGLGLLTLGNLLEPFQGGIKKVPETISYLLATPGLAILAFTGLLLIQKTWPKLPGFGFFARTGQNPLLAYLAMTNLAEPLWELTAGKWTATLDITPWQEFGFALIQTTLLGGLVVLFTQRKVFFRV